MTFFNDAPVFTKPTNPVVYLEYDTFSNLNFTMRNDNATNISQSTVLADYNQWTSYVQTNNDEAETPMWVVNQAALGTWYGMNTAEPWKQYLNVLYSMVNVALGADTQDAWCFEQMKVQYFLNTTSIQQFLLPNLPPSQAVLDAMLNDPWYGLSNIANYVRWNVLAPVP